MSEQPMDNLTSTQLHVRNTDGRIAPHFFDRPAVEVARALLDCVLLVDGIGGPIVETEAYDREDPASHSFAGPTARNAAMFGRPGRAYVYRSYGIHWCFNMVCGAPGHGAAVLIRAIEPRYGLDAMVARRGLDDPRLLCSGPGRLGQALGITRAHDGLPLDMPPFSLLAPDMMRPVATGQRMGITKAVDTLWRFAVAGSPFVSRRAGLMPET